MEMTFGDKIKEARKIKKFTQKQLADRIGAKHNSVSDWENNKNKPDPDTIELLCGVLDVTPNYLLANDGDSISPSDKLIIKKYHSLDQHGQELVDTILDKEYSRCKSSASITKFPVTGLNAAHERTDIPESSKTDEAKKIEEDIMDDENF